MTIPYAQVNDDYCDCPDGSDEPGTSACSNGRFYCANEGHIPAFLRSSQVNDGVCDEACCDGSDETDGKVHCPNVCAKVHKAYVKAQQHEQKLYDAGSKIRAAYVQQAEDNRILHQKAIARLTLELGKAEASANQLKEARDAAEKASSALDQQKRQSALYAQLELRQTALRQQHEAIQRLSEELQTVAKIVSRLERGSGAEEVASVSDAFQIWLGRTFDDDSDDDRVQTLEEKLEPLLSLPDFSAEDIETLIQADPLELMPDVSTYEGAAPATRSPSCTSSD